jgi:carboxyl-terminal processing protease
LFVGTPLTRVVTKRGKTHIYRSLNKYADRKTSLLLLTNGNTASASEIFAAALRDHKRALIVGHGTTHGKNIAQVIEFTTSLKIIILLR